MTANDIEVNTRRSLHLRHRHLAILFYSAVTFLSDLSICSIVVLQPCAVRAADVLTQRYNSQRTGSTIQRGMNQSTVANSRWGYVGKLDVVGTVYAQPLFVEGLQFPANGGQHDVVYVATAKNNVYAFDAHTLLPLWTSHPQGVHLADNDTTETGHPGCDGISKPDGIGIEATPIIDRQRGVMYVAYRTNTSHIDPRTARQRLGVIDLRTGTLVHHVRLTPPNAHPSSTDGSWLKTQPLYGRLVRSPLRPTPARERP